MNSLDLAMLFIMTVAIAVSTFRGGVRELFSLASVILGFFVAMHYYHATSDSFLRLTSYKHVNDTISFIAIFVFSAVLISFIGGRISGMVKKSGLGFLDHILGTTIGAIKGILICALITYALMVFLPSESHILKGSKTLPYISQATSIISPIGTQAFKDEFKKKLDELKKQPEPPAKNSEPAKKEKTPPKG